MTPSEKYTVLESVEIAGETKEVNSVVELNPADEVTVKLLEEGKIALTPAPADDENVKV